MDALRVAIIDYEAGNLRSIATALTLAGADVVLAPTPQEAGGCDAVLLPGVGAFGAAMQRLEAAGFPAWLRGQVDAGVPLIGVCLGMQLLFESSEESDGVRGLGLLQGDVGRLPSGLKVPHMGWNQVVPRPGRPFDVVDQAFFYFAHSYLVRPADAAVVAASVRYGMEVPAAVRCGCILGMQFHPEKSGAVGQRLLQGVIAWCANVRAVPSGA
ncbi:MAG TPA: imidazole glycerol phosphate synthase subunit HisH [bacterium]|jgi:glutamine amidotransferase